MTGGKGSPANGNIDLYISFEWRRISDDIQSDYELLINSSNNIIINIYFFESKRKFAKGLPSTRHAVKKETKMTHFRYNKTMNI